MSITEDGLSQLLSSYGSNESENSSDDMEDSVGKETIKSIHPHKTTDDGGSEDCNIKSRRQALYLVVY